MVTCSCSGCPDSNGCSTRHYHRQHCDECYTRTWFRPAFPEVFGFGGPRSREHEIPDQCHDRRSEPCGTTQERLMLHGRRFRCQRARQTQCPQR